MKVISIIVEHMHDTLDEIKQYYRDYIIFEDDYPKAANVALDIGNTHLSIYMKLHDSAEYLINEYKMKNVEVPKDMLSLWNKEHLIFEEEYSDMAYKYSKLRNR